MYIFKNKSKNQKNDVILYNSRNYIIFVFHLYLACIGYNIKEFTI
jgi:hypothetical protein